MDTYFGEGLEKGKIEGKIEGKIGHFKGKVKLTAEEYYKQIGLANHVDKVFA